MSVIDIDVAYKLSIALVATMTAYSTYAILAIVSWPVLFVIIPMVYLTILLQVLQIPTLKLIVRFLKNIFVYDWKETNPFSASDKYPLKMQHILVLGVVSMLII